MILVYTDFISFSIAIDINFLIHFEKFIMIILSNWISARPHRKHKIKVF